MNTLAPHDLLWCVRRLPRSVVALCKAHPGAVFVAGGYVRSRVSNEPVNDVDLFVSAPAHAETFALEIAGGDATRLHKTDNAVSVKGTRPMVQIIHRWTFATPKDALASFDFTIAAAAFWWDGAHWQSACDPAYYADLAGKRLAYRSPARNEDAGGSMLRVLKFYQRGYRIPLDSLGAVMARLVSGVSREDRASWDQAQWAKVLTGLLREVDPSTDPDHIAHLPSAVGSDELENP